MATTFDPGRLLPGHLQDMIFYLRIHYVTVSNSLCTVV